MITGYIINYSLVEILFAFVLTIIMKSPQTQGGYQEKGKFSVWFTEIPFKKQEGMSKSGDWRGTGGGGEELE